MGLPRTHLMHGVSSVVEKPGFLPRQPLLSDSRYFKQIAAQSNGYVVLNFTNSDGDTIERRLSLSVQMAQKIMDKGVIPIRYQKNTYQEIVMMPVYDIQKSTSVMNMIIAIIGTVILSIAGIFVTRYANKRAQNGAPKLVVERIDQ